MAPYFFIYTICLMYKYTERNDKGMAFIIGAGTTTSLAGVQSVSVSQEPNIQYQYVLGQASPFFKLITIQTQISITTYGGRGFTASLPVSVNCQDASTVNFSVSPGSCVGTAVGIAGDFFIAGYSYSKEVDGFGTQTYNLVGRPLIEVEGQTVNFPEPIMLRGQSTGQAINPSLTGITFGGTTNAGIGIQVSAGFPGIGNSDESLAGEVSAIAPGVFFQPGQGGSGNVTVPYTPLYV